QNAHYQEGSQNPLACQEELWKEVFPLFDKGERAAQTAQAWLKLPATPTESLLFQQQESASNWKKAVQLLESPPRSGAAAQEEKESTANTEEVFRNIEEMELQDAPKKPISQVPPTSW